MKKYGGLSGGSPVSLTGEFSARIIDVNLDTMTAIGRAANSQRIEIDLSVGVLGIINIPTAGDSWYVTKVSGVYVLTRRSKIQNQSLIETDKKPGDLLLNVERLRIRDKYGVLSKTTRVIKEEDETRASGVSLANDSDLFFSLEPDKDYFIRGILFVVAETSESSFAVNFLTPPDASLKLRTGGSVQTTGVVTFSTSTTVIAVNIEGIIRTASSSGVFNLQWGTPSGSSSPSTLQELSFLEIVTD